MKGSLIGGLAIGLAAFAVAALASPSMLVAFNNTYKTRIPANSALSKASCAICHQVVPKLNPYGTDIKRALAGGKVLTPAILKQVENLDSDKDGVSNIDEIKKGTLPGDPRSK